MIPPRQSLLRRLRKLLITLVVTYLLVVVLMWILENRLVYRPDSAADHWENPTDPAIEEVTFAMADGTRIHAWYLPHPDSSEAMILCHGNGGNISYRSQSLLRFRQHLGCSVLIFDYPGYGKSAGKPNEEACYASAEAALKWLAESKQIPCERVLLYGESLGGGVAVEMAKRHPVLGLVLFKTFTTLPDVAQGMYRLLPVKLLMRHRYDNIGKIRDVHCPVFIASATHDTLIPFGMGQELHAAANEPKLFFALENEDHNDSSPDDYLLALRRFLDQHKAPKLP